MSSNCELLVQRHRGHTRPGLLDRRHSFRQPPSADLSSYQRDDHRPAADGRQHVRGRLSELTLGDLILSTVAAGVLSVAVRLAARLPLAADETAGGTVSYYRAPGSTACPGDGAGVRQPAGVVCLRAGQLDSSDGRMRPTRVGHGHACQLDARAPTGTPTLTFAGERRHRARPGDGDALDRVARNRRSTSIGDRRRRRRRGPGRSTPPARHPRCARHAASTDGNLNIGYLTSPGDLNDWPVTVSQDDELSLALTNLPATYDLELFGPTAQQLQGTPDQDFQG